MKSKKKLTLIISIVATVLILFSVVLDIVLQKSKTEKTDFAMGAVISLKVTGRKSRDTAEEIVSAIKARENEISKKIEASEISLLNKNKTLKVSDKTSKMLKSILDVCEKSSGAVDLTIGKLTGLWNIGSENFAVPPKKDIENILKDVSWEKVVVKNNTVSIGKNQELDLGFAGKGLACDDAKEILIRNRISKGIINVGGSLCLYGDGDFTVGVRNPFGDVSDYMAVLTVEESFISTSGNYERFSEYKGEKYHHILSTETGYPVENNLLSVTVVCDSGLLSDALSTACYCLGYEGSIELLKQYNAQAVFIFDTKEVKVTDGLKNKIEIKNDEFELWKEN